MSGTSGFTRRPLAKSPPRHRVPAVPLALAVLLLAPVLVPRPAAAGLLDDLWAGLRHLWGETSWQLDPSGRPAPEPPSGASALWGEEGWQIDPNGLVARPPSGGASALWGEEGWQIDPGGLVKSPPIPTDAPDRP